MSEEPHLTNVNLIYEHIIDQLLDKDFAIANLFFEARVLDGLYDNTVRNLEEEEFRRAGIGNIVTHEINKEIRRDKILWLNPHTSDPYEKSYLDRVWDFAQYMNRTCFTGNQTMEFHYACYETGAFYKRHIDQFRLDDARSFSLITYLNRNWEKKVGGELVLYLPAEEITILPEFGTTVFLKSDKIEHEVLTSARMRMSITGWLKTGQIKGLVV